MSVKRKVLASLCILGLGAVVLAEEAPKAPLTEYVPDGALLYAAWPGQTASLKSTKLFLLLSELNAGRLLEEEAQRRLQQAKEWQASLPEQTDVEDGEVDDNTDTPEYIEHERTAREYERQHDLMAKLDLQRPLLLNILARTWRCPMAFTITAMGKLPTPDGEQEANDLSAEWHWLIDLGSEHQRFDRWLKEVLEPLDMLKVEKTKQGWRLTLADGRALYLGYVHEGVFCLTTQEDALSALGGLRLEKSLARSKRFLDHIGQVRGTAEIGLLYVDYARLLDQSMGALPDEARKERLRARCASGVCG